MPSTEPAQLNHAITSWRNSWVDQATAKRGPGGKEPAWSEGKTQEEVLVAMLTDAREAGIPELDFDTTICWKTLKSACTQCGTWAKLHWYIVTIEPTTTTSAQGNATQRQTDTQDRRSSPACS